MKTQDQSREAVIREVVRDWLMKSRRIDEWRAAATYYATLAIIESLRERDVPMIYDASQHFDDDRLALSVLVPRERPYDDEPWQIVQRVYREYFESTIKEAVKEVWHKNEIYVEVRIDGLRATIYCPLEKYPF